MKIILIPVIALTTCGVTMCLAGMINMVLRADAPADNCIGTAIVGLIAIGVACGIGYTAQKRL